MDMGNALDFVERMMNGGEGSVSEEELRVRKKIVEGQCRNYSDQSMLECLQYVYTQNGKVIHAKAKNNIDPSAISENHGDRVIADALAMWVIDEVGPRPTHTQEIPDNCFASRRKEYLSKRKQDVSTW